jgi:hypothetical protein
LNQLLVGHFWGSVAQKEVFVFKPVFKVLKMKFSEGETLMPFSATGVHVQFIIRITEEPEASVLCGKLSPFNDNLLLLKREEEIASFVGTSVSNRPLLAV